MYKRGCRRYASPFRSWPVAHGIIGMNIAANKGCAMNVRRRYFAFSLPLLVALAALGASVQPVYADYEVTNVDVTAEVASDGTMKVTECRSFEFDDDINGVYWTIPLADNQQGAKSTVDIQSVDVDGSFFKHKKSAESGQNGVYTVSTSTGDGEDSVKLKVYMPREDGDAARVTITYETTGAVMRWADTGELYWKFIGSDWDVDSESVSLTVSFDSALTAATPATKKTLRAWGHGPLSGEVQPDIKNARVCYTVPTVRSGVYAEARVAFPVAWVSDMPQGSSKKRMSAILSEEKKWANEANARREEASRASNIAAGACVGVPAVFAAVFATLKSRRRKNKATFNETYYRDVPSSDHPALIATFMAGGAVPDSALIATLMKLTNERAITLEKDSYTKQKLLGGQRQLDDYRVTLTKESYNRLSGKLDRNALELYFYGQSFNSGTTTISRSFHELKTAVSGSRRAYNAQFEAYQSVAKQAVDERGLVVSTGVAAKVVAIVLGLLLEFANLFVLTYMDFEPVNIAAFVAGTVLIVAGIAMGCTFRRLTQEGAELEAKCRALKKWLQDFTRLKEAVPGDLVLWNNLLVMGVALGVSQEVISQLADAVPAEIRDSDDFYDYYPGYWWYYDHDGLGTPSAAFRDAYGESISELASSSDSSGGGFGGGFSGGGGGGVGGGGGGTF